MKIPIYKLMPSGVPLYNETPEGSIDFKALSFQRKPKQRLFPVLREMSAKQPTRRLPP